MAIEQENQYIENPSNCLWCGSPDIESPVSENDQDFTIMTANVYCKSCNKKWREVYELKSIIEL